MAEALKDMFNKSYYRNLAIELNKNYKNFSPDNFVKDLMINHDELSLNERLRNTSIVLKKHLPSDYKKSIDILSHTIPQLNSGYTTLVFPDFVGLYGHEHFSTSMEALKYFTQFGSSEFAIREYLKRDFNKTIKVMEKWATDKNHHVRRLASEGSRPRLPWSFKLDMVIKKPETTLTILETLKQDTELYVKKSVANHLNDISKDNSDWMLNTVSKWNTQNPNTQWIIKHASRTLIKKGNTQSLQLFGFEKTIKVEVANFKINKNKLKLGEVFEFSFDVVSQKNKNQKLAIDYIIYYQKKLGEISPKVFKLKELNLEGNNKLSIQKKHRFEDFTTRKHYSGKHVVEIVINGNALAKKEFELVV
ncbi:MAG: DNA alkylation repair protein [Bacteroidia bacterium]